MRLSLLALACIGWAGLAHAVALGEIDVTSHLNQTVVATIPVTTNKPGELEGATVELASNEEFDRAGMERPEFLSTLRFEIKDGYIKVTSKQIAKEPFVNFLLDVRWGGGRLLREYTILLDPPSLGTTTASARPKPAPVPQPAQATAPEPAAAQPAETPAGAAPAESQMAPAESAPAAAPTAAAPAETTAAAPAAMGGTYGPTSPQETLWSIAYKLRPDTALTMDQMQVAIYNKNPQAFDHGRFGGLMKGVTLQIPTADEVRAVDPVAAKAQVAAARGAPLPEAAPKPAKPSKAKPAAVPAPQAEEKPVEAAPAPTPAPAPAPKVEAPAPKVEAPAPKPEPKPEPAKPAPASSLPPPSAPAPSAPPPASTPPPSAAPATTAAPPASTAPAAATPAPQAKPAETPAEKPAEKPVEKAAEKPAEKPAAKPAAPSGGLVSDILDSVKGMVSSAWFIPAVGIFILVVAGLLGYKKIGEIYGKWAYNRAARKTAAASAAAAAPPAGNEDVTQAATDLTPEQIAAGEAVTQMAPAPVAETQAMAAQTLQQTMQGTAQQTMQQTFQQTQVAEPPQAQTGGRGVDFDVTGNFANETVQINLDAGDPVSEAEFHRAYGLYDEAALLLKQALQKDPKRTDARVKLAEIYFEASKANEFVETAKELKAQLPPEEWQKIALLGSQIAPNNEMFAGGAASSTGTVDLSFDEPSTPAAAPAAAAAPAPAAAPAADAGLLDFKLEDVQLDVPAAAAPAAAPAAAAPAEGALEFDLGSLSLDTPAAAPAAAPEPALEAAPAAAPSGDLNLADFDLGTEAASAPAPAAVSVSMPAVEESLDLSADLSVEPAAGDESSTKLDLARAYIDMGDNDMAKSLLNEVAQQGNAQQKNEAQELLKRVNA